MLIKILLVISIIVQTLATAYALRLVRATKYNSVWILFIVGFSLLSVERFVQLLMAGGHYVPRWWFGYLGIVVSVCLSIGVMYAHKLFKYIDRLNRQRQLLNKRILTAVLRTEEKARSRFSKELHDGLGPLLSSARMSLSALSREERSADQREIIDNTTYVIDEAIRSLDCGMGLSNISSRINSLGGTFGISSAKGKGMRAAIRVNTQQEPALPKRKRRNR